MGAGCARGGGLRSSGHLGRNSERVLRSWSGVFLPCVLLVLLVQCKSQAEVHRSKRNVPNNLVFPKACLISRGYNGTKAFQIPHPKYNLLKEKLMAHNSNKTCYPN